MAKAMEEEVEIAVEDIEDMAKEVLLMAEIEVEETMDTICHSLCIWIE
jgi:hypothetical protein